MKLETPIRKRSIPVGENGRMNLPADLRRKLGIAGAGRITIEEYQDRIEIVSLEQRLARIDTIMDRYRRSGVSMVDELIADRRAEVAKEAEQDTDREALRAKHG